MHIFIFILKLLFNKKWKKSIVKLYKHFYKNNLNSENMAAFLMNVGDAEGGLTLVFVSKLAVAA